MKEEFLHFIWKQELFNKHLQTELDEVVEVISTGTSNTDAGPDFLNARIKIGNTIWAGNIEIHNNSADWEKHKHHLDPSYNNVILHIVEKFSKKAIRKNGEEVPTCVLQYEKNLSEHYQNLIASKLKIPCQKNLNTVDDFTINMWLDSLIIERVEEKTDYIKGILKQENNNWEESFYIILARSFGFKVNALPFELLAKSVPLNILGKYSTNIFQLEALLFGQAGFLEDDFQDVYFQKIKKEYNYIKKLHRLKPIEKHLWKFLRLRPSNFPTIRIAQFSALINKSRQLFSKTMEANSLKNLLTLYTVELNEYWENRYTFEKTTKKRVKKLGKTALFGLFINTVIPFMFIYGKLRGKQELMDGALTLLQEIPSEINSITRTWKELGIDSDSAARSQALIQLNNNYCKLKNCLYCQIGNIIIRNKN